MAHERYRILKSEDSKELAKKVSLAYHEKYTPVPGSFQVVIEPRHGNKRPKIWYCQAISRGPQYHAAAAPHNGGDE